MNKFFLVTLFVVLVVLGTQQLPGLFVLNSGSNPWLTDNGSKPALQIENSIVDGAASFLKAHAEILLFLNKIEAANTAGLDFPALQKNLDSAIFHLENAKVAYLQLKTTAIAAPYNPAVLQKLRVLNYTTMQQEKGLNSIIFGKVVKYLKTGDVRGVFNQFYSEVTLLLARLHDLQAPVAAQTIPDINKLWQLNQHISEVQLFGQYAAQVFMSL